MLVNEAKSSSTFHIGMNALIGTGQNACFDFPNLGQIVGY